MSNGYGRSTGGFGISRDASIELIVKVALEEGVTDPRQVAYILATAQHETRNFDAPEEDYGRSQARKRHYRGGEDYFGRGYVHLTHVENYGEFDKLLGLDGQLLKDPDLAKDPEIAARILVIGMRDGKFTGRPLDRYINASEADLYNARRIVNGIIPAETWTVEAARKCEAYARNWVKEVPELIASAGKFKGVPFSLPETRQLQVGARGADVAVLQEGLNQLGYRDKDGRVLDVDRHYGERTREAIEAFQRERDMPITGVADRRTLDSVRVSLGTRDPVKEFRAFVQRFTADGDRMDRHASASGVLVDAGLGQSRGALDPPQVPKTAKLYGSRPESKASRPEQPTQDGSNDRNDERLADLRALQRQLNQLGFRDVRDNELVVDGSDGPRMREAIARFQQDKAMQVTGVPDERTRDAIGAYALVAQIDERKLAQQAAQKPTFLDAAHPDHPLFLSLRERLPAEVTDEKVAALTLQAKRAGILVARIEEVGIHGDNVFAYGRDLGAGTAVVSLSRPAPSLEDTMRQSTLFDEQQEQNRLAQQQRSAVIGGRSH